MHKFILFFILCVLGFAGLVLLGIFGGTSMLMVAIGPCIVFFAFKDYDWFMISDKPAPLRAILGRDGTRILESVK